jgi:hypothetical protein
VVHQRIRNSGIKDVGESIIMGQGMVFNKKEKSQDIRLGQKLRREGTGMTGDRSHPVRTSLLEKRPPKRSMRNCCIVVTKRTEVGTNHPWTTKTVLILQ